jgi:hypothetical protein
MVRLAPKPRKGMAEIKHEFYYFPKKERTILNELKKVS